MTTGSHPTACPAHADSVSTLHHGVRRLHRGQVSDDSDIIVSAGALNVDVDGTFNLPVEACHHACRVCHVGQATLAVVPGRGEIVVRVTAKEEGNYVDAHISHTHKHCLQGRKQVVLNELAVVLKANTGGQQCSM